MTHSLSTLRSLSRPAVQATTQSTTTPSRTILSTALFSTALLCTALAACAEPQTVREEVASELSARPDTVVLSADAASEPAADDAAGDAVAGTVAGAAYLNPARDPEGNRYGGDSTDAQLSTNNQPGMAEPSKAVDEDARPDG